MQTLERFIGCLIGGACGDALGYPVEFMQAGEIMQIYGKSGIRDLKPDLFYKKAPISDDTQMTLFTLNGLLAAHHEAKKTGHADWVDDGLWPAYQRWYYTQTGTIAQNSWRYPFPWENKNDYIMALDNLTDRLALFACRAPGHTCLSGLGKATPGNERHPHNNSKGNGGVMRVAPIGLFFDEPNIAYLVGKRAAAITHGHPTGYIAAGVAAYIICELANGEDLSEAVKDAITQAEHWDGEKAAETTEALRKALKLALDGVKSGEGIQNIGRGWVAEEALAIAVFCALGARDAEHAVIAAVNHSGDSDSTGAICGNIVGARDGFFGGVFPDRWTNSVELFDFIVRSAKDLYEASDRSKEAVND